MDNNSIEKVCNIIYRRFPTFKDQRPRVTKRGEGNYLLLFSSCGKTPDGKIIQQIVRVVASEAGQIIKTSMSR